jgi:hypothetical protein
MYRIYRLVESASPRSPIRSSPRWDRSFGDHRWRRWHRRPSLWKRCCGTRQDARPLTGGAFAAFTGGIACIFGVALTSNVTLSSRGAFTSGDTFTAGVTLSAAVTFTAGVAFAACHALAIRSSWLGRGDPIADVRCPRRRLFRVSRCPRRRGPRRILDGSSRFGDGSASMRTPIVYERLRRRLRDIVRGNG